MNMKKIRKIAITWLLLVSLILPMLPSIDWSVFAADDNVESNNGYRYTFEAGSVAVINQALVNQIAVDHPEFAEAPTFVIKNGVFSVTVNGPFTYADPTTQKTREVSVNVVFGSKETNAEGKEYYQGVTIDRTKETVSNGIIGNQTIDGGGWTTLEELYEAGKTLGWTYNNNNNQYYVPTAPFLITGGAKVTALFLGETTIKAHLNRRYVSLSNNSYSLNRDTNDGVNNAERYCGYAGIQVDGDCSLEITNVTDGTLNVYGAHQLPGATVSGYTYPKDPLSVNPIFDTSRDSYAAPEGALYDSCAGGAAIGGGAKYNTVNSKSADYTQGTPGEIIINGGKIYAVGGHLAAAIGGGFNGGATTSKIEINDGNITAIGGRFATAIGDGDSLDRNNSTAVNGEQNPSPSFIKPSQIIINGGTINAYGGTAAAAIGTTDEVSDNSRDNKGFGADAVSGMTITITGGYIEAQSGAANPSANNSNCAAIGVGDKTNMRENSITIYSSAVVFARSFSEFAISNTGIGTSVEEKIPTVNIDPDGFMYLARFDQNSNNERDLTLYPVVTDSEGNPVAIAEEAYDTLNANGVLLQGQYYARTIATVNGGETGVYLYKVKWENNQFVPDLSDGEKQYLAAGNSKWYSYHYDVSNPVYTFKVPKTYKAIALTMGKGDYIFHIPTGNSSINDDIYAHFSKKLSGTTSVEVIGGTNTEPSYYHFSYANPNEGGYKDTPHVEVDATAAPFSSMQLIYEDTPKLNYGETVLGYTVYLPHEATHFNLNLKYSTAGVQKIVVQFSELTAKTTENGDNYSITDEIEYTGNGKLTGDHTVYFAIPENKEKGSERVFDIWVNKVDNVSGGSQSFITYRITVVIKAEYYINVESLSKQYDGQPVSPNILSVTESIGDEITEKFEDHVVKLADGSSTPVVYGNHISSYQKEGSKAKMTYTAKDSDRDIPITIEYAVVPNETETSISIITRFIYQDVNGNEVKKRSTVNINMDGSLLFTLDASSDTVLMASSLGNYLIKTGKRDEWLKVDKDGNLIVDKEGNYEKHEGHDAKTDGDDGCLRKVYWTVYISHYAIVEGKLEETQIPVLEFEAFESVEVKDADSANQPMYSGDGKIVYDSLEEAKAQALKDAEKALKPVDGAGNAHEIRFSDSYFYSNGKTEEQKFTLTVTHDSDNKCTKVPVDSDGNVLSGEVQDFSFTIVDDYIYMYYKFHYYANKETKGKTISFSKEQLDQIEYRYYRDVNGDGLIYEEDGDIYIGEKAEAPKDAGDYVLVLDYKGEKYEAFTAIAFEIRKRPIEITRVENWLTYLDAITILELNNSGQPNHLKTYPLLELDPNISEEDKAAFLEKVEAFKNSGWKEMFGTVYFSNLVEGDVVELSDKVYAYYNEITISYNASKITLRYDAYQDADGNWHGYQIDWLADKAGPDANGQYANDNRNYELTGVSNFRHTQVENESGEMVENPNPLDFSYVHIAGMLAYESEGAIFRKSENDVWHKYWPTTSENPLDWDETGDTDQLGNYIKPDMLEEGIDYESPSNASHQKHVFVITKNADRVPKYSFDVEFGSLEFVYAKSVWDVNSYQYEASDESKWVTNDGTTNKITVTNRSDAAITFSASVTATHLAVYDVTIGFSQTYSVEKAELPNLKRSYTNEIPSAVDNNGNPKKAVFYLIVDGDQPKSQNKVTVGTLSVTVSPKDASDDDHDH